MSNVNKKQCQRRSCQIGPGANVKHLLTLLAELDLQTQNLIGPQNCNCATLGLECSVCKLERVRGKLNQVVANLN